MSERLFLFREYTNVVVAFLLLKYKGLSRPVRGALHFLKVLISTFFSLRDARVSSSKSLPTNPSVDKAPSSHKRLTNATDTPYVVYLRREEGFRPLNFSDLDPGCSQKARLCVDFSVPLFEQVIGYWGGASADLILIRFASQVHYSPRRIRA